MKWKLICICLLSSLVSYSCSSAKKKEIKDICVAVVYIPIFDNPIMITEVAPKVRIICDHPSTINRLLQPYPVQESKPAE